MAVITRAETEQAELVCELPGQVIANETEIIILFHDVAGGLHALLLDYLFPHRESEVIRVDMQRNLLIGRHGPHDIRMALDRIEIRLLGHKVSLAQQPRMP